MSEPQYIHIRNWGRYQHHKNRAVPWIKDYARQLSDDEYRDLSFHQRGLLHDLRLEYLRTQGRGIRDTTATLTRRLGQRVMRRDVEALSDAGLIELSSRQTLEPVYARIEESREENPLTPFTEEPKNAQTAKVGEPLVLLDEVKAKRGRKRDELFEAVIDALGMDAAEITTSQRGAVNKCLGELRAVDAKPGEVKPRVAVYNQRYPDHRCTAPALAKHWPTLKTLNGYRGPRTAAEKNARDDARRAELEAQRNQA